MSDEFKSGYAAIVGPPNVGKSTLLNRLLGQKIAIVSPRPQTTRNRILGIVTGDEFQILFLDTPGIFQPGYRLQKIMVETAKLALRQADLVLLMTEAGRRSGPDEDMVIDLLSQTKTPSVLAINKVDILKDKSRLLPLIEVYRQRYAFCDIVPISALTGDGLDELMRVLIQHLPAGPQYYPEDMLTDSPERFIAAEIIREKVFLRTGEEIPYSVAVRVEEYREKENVLYIKATIYVERNSQKGILIGEGGRKLKQIGTLAREELQGAIGRKVFLDLWVKIRRKWRQKDQDLRFLGYSVPG